MYPLTEPLAGVLHERSTRVGDERSTALRLWGGVGGCGPPDGGEPKPFQSAWLPFSATAIRLPRGRSCLIPVTLFTSFVDVMKTASPPKLSASMSATRYSMRFGETPQRV